VFSTCLTKDYHYTECELYSVEEDEGRTKGLLSTRKATAVRRKAKRRKTSGVTAVTVRSSNYRVNSGELRPHWWCA